MSNENNLQKYITYQHTNDFPSFVAFDAQVEHKEMANMLNSKEILGAGFVHFGDEVECRGESISMNIKSRGEIDSRLIACLSRLAKRLSL